MRVLITGVSGFLGRRLARHLAACGSQVSGTYLGERPELPGVEAHHADLLDLEALGQALESSAPEVVVHLAGLSHVGQSWQRMGDYFQVNVLGTENLLKLVREQRVVLASSAEIYGDVPESEQPIGEERMPAPQSPYALTKAAVERLGLAVGAVIVRPFNLVGPGQSRQFALPSFAAQLAEIRRGREQPVLRVGNLSARRDFLHVDDAVRGYELLIGRGERAHVYNLGRGEACSIAEALERLLAVSGVEVEIEKDAERLRPHDVPLLQADAGRLRALGWRPVKSLDDALEDLWQETLQACS